MNPDTLFPVGPSDESTLTVRQAAVLTVARAPEGVDPLEAGKAAHGVSGCRFCTGIHACQYAESDGNAILRRLRDLGHVRYRSKLKTWHATTGASTSQLSAADPFPEGF